MSNMSYCRFENTLNDLQDCADHIHEIFSKGLSKREAHKAYRLVLLCAEIAEEYYTRIEVEYDPETYEENFEFDDEDDENE